MEKSRRTALPVVGLLWLLSFPASAVGGYDIAHIVERTCEPGGSLIVADMWKRPQDRDRVITEPGEVIACPRVGPKSSFQIAAGPERIGRERHLCTYFSLLNGDGADTCFGTDSADGARLLVKPLMAIRADRSGRLALAGIVSDDVAAVALAPAGGSSREPTVIPIDGQRAARLGATGAFGYFSLTVDRRILCADERPRVLGRDSSGRRTAESTVPISAPLLDSADRVPYARSLEVLCREADGDEAGRDGDRASAVGADAETATATAERADGPPRFTGLALGGIAVLGLLVTLGVVSRLSTRARRGRAARRTP